MGHEELKDLVAAYGLGALDPDDRRLFQSHIATCEECAAAARSLQPVVGSLARAVPGRRPPPDLRARVLAAVVPSGPVVLERPNLFASPGAARWALAAMLLLTAGIGVYALQLSARIADLEARLQTAVQQTSAAESAVADASRVAFQSQSAMAVLAAVDLARIDLTGEPPAPAARARALWSRQWGMVFAASALPPLPPGMVYQVWVVTAQAPISAGLVTPDASGGAVTVFDTPPDIPPPVAVAVTLEPAGGVPAPTGARYLMGTVGT